MAVRKNLAKVSEAAIEYPDLFGTRTDEQGRILNLSTCYDVFRRLPDHVKLRIGRSCYVIRPQIRALIEGRQK